MPDDAPVAIVTGSSSGIGRAIAIRLACEGYHVALNYGSRDEEAGEVLAECREIDPDTFLIKADLGEVPSAISMVRAVVRKLGRIDVLINNAARVIDRPALEMTQADWDGVMNVNLRGAFFAAQEAARHMLAQDDGGVILNIGASTGIRGRRNGTNTCASKAGLMIMTQCLALELAPKVRVNTIVPGLVVTDETTARFGLMEADALGQRRESVPLHRLGQPDDIADAVMLLLSAEARFITGQKLVVDGGQNMW